DMHSRSGYSGSPVFAFRTLGADLTGRMMEIGPDHQFVKFLGVHVGQFPELWELKTKEMSENAMIRNADAAYVRGMSGMTVVAPAWSLVELLNMPGFRNPRDDAARRLNAPLGGSG
ncbi:MAG TPA: hypothetical protein VFV07_08870, partial [Rhizomicrobium sp.]|nr:hypothetical protein [Rhizomicrobium sp.]